MPDAAVATPATPAGELHVYAPITYVSKAADDANVRIVYGIVSDDSLDVDQQRVDRDWLRRELPKWLTEWGNIREMHRDSAVGKGTELTEIDDQFWLTSRIIDPAAVRKVDEGIYKGYSIGIKWPKLARDPTAPLGRIVDGTIVETSLVDRPANSNAKLTLVKSPLADVNADTLEAAQKAAIPHKDGEPQSAPAGYPDTQDADHYADPENYSWPIDTPERVKSALSYYNAGNGKDKYAPDEWALIGKRIAAAASRVFEKPYLLKNGSIEPQDGANKAAAAGDAAPDHGAVTGTHTHAHPAFGDQGGDQTHTHEHSHDGDAAHAPGDNHLHGTAVADGKSAQPDASKAGREFSTANLGKLQQAHDAIADATGGQVCDTYRGGKPGDAKVSDMSGVADTKQLEADLTKSVQAQVEKSVRDALSAMPDIKALLAEALAPFNERLKAIEERPADNGPLIAAVRQQTKTAEADTVKTALRQQANEAYQKAITHSDAQVRAYAYRDYVDAANKLKALG